MNTTPTAELVSLYSSLSAAHQDRASVEALRGTALGRIRSRHAAVAALSLRAECALLVFGSTHNGEYVR